MARRLSRQSNDNGGTIGQRLARIRKERGVTQAELAAHLGTVPGVISDYELGKLRLHGQTIVEVARFLRISADELLGLKGAKPPVPRPPRRFLRRLERLESLPEHKQRALIQTIDAFLGSAGAA